MATPISSLKPSGGTNAAEMEKSLDLILQKHEENLKKFALLQQRITEQQTKISSLQKKVRQEKEQSAVLATNLAVQRPEVAQLLETKKKMNEVFNQIKSLLTCEGCKKIAVLPLVVGLCGHVECQKCVAGSDAAVAHNAKIGCYRDSVDSYVLDWRRCRNSDCMKNHTVSPVVGQGLPVLPLKNMVNLLLEEGIAEKGVSEGDQKSSAAAYDLSKIDHARGLRALAIAERTREMAAKITAKIGEFPWKRISVYFSVGCSELMFEVFCAEMRYPNEAEKYKSSSFIVLSQRFPRVVSEDSYMISVTADYNFAVTKR